MLFVRGLGGGWETERVQQIDEEVLDQRAQILLPAAPTVTATEHDMAGETDVNLPKMSIAGYAWIPTHGRRRRGMLISMYDAEIVDACRRRGIGGSPTAVLEDGDFTDAERREIPVATGTSHAVFIRAEDAGAAGLPAFSLRFFTSEGELPACGHGTVAAMALLAVRAPQPDDEYRAVLRTGNRRFDGWAVREDGRLTASFDPGPVSLRAAETDELGAVAAGLGLDDAAIAGSPCVASVGRERLLLPVRSRAALAGLTPDFAALRAACDRHGFLGCYVYSVPGGDGSAAARMFAPSIGVPEDVANANSTGCLAAHLAEQGLTRLSVDMGDGLGSPSTITATVHDEPGGRRIRLGGEAAPRA